MSVETTARHRRILHRAAAPVAILCLLLSASCAAESGAAPDPAPAAAVCSTSTLAPTQPAPSSRGLHGGMRAV